MTDGTRLWRLHRNPLMRRCDVVETVALLAAWAVIVLGTLTAGGAAFSGTHATLTEQRESAHATGAVLVRNTADPSSGAEVGDHTTGTVRWTERDGSVQVQTVRLEEPGRAGDDVRIWLDERGRPVPPPPAEGEAFAQSVAVGTLAAGVTCGAGFAGRRMVRVRLERQREESWGRSWALVEPRWAGRHGR